MDQQEKEIRIADSRRFTQMILISWMRRCVIADVVYNVDGPVIMPSMGALSELSACPSIEAVFRGFAGKKIVHGCTRMHTDIVVPWDGPCVPPGILFRKFIVEFPDDPATPGPRASTVYPCASVDDLLFFAEPRAPRGDAHREEFQMLALAGTR